MMWFKSARASNLKKLLWLLSIVLFVLGISILFTTDMVAKQPDSMQQSIAEKFNQIKNELEFKGLTGSVKTLTEDYSKLFDGYSNIIITDDNGNILFNVNSGYISEKNKFLVLVDPWEVNGYGANIAYLIDGKNNIKYSVQLDIALNMSTLKEKSARNPLSKMLFTQTQEALDSFADKQTANSDGTTYTISAEANIIMNCEYIASKGFNLYSLYDSEHQYNNYYILANSLRSLNHWLVIAALILLGFFWVLLPLWVFFDAHKYKLNVALWTLITFFFSLPGLCIYLIYRPKYTRCDTCKKALENGWIVCPYCGDKVNSNLPNKD